MRHKLFEKQNGLQKLCGITSLWRNAETILAARNWPRAPPKSQPPPVPHSIIPHTRYIAIGNPHIFSRGRRAAAPLAAMLAFWTYWFHVGRFNCILRGSSRRQKKQFGRNPTYLVYCGGCLLDGRSVIQGAYHSNNQFSLIMMIFIP